MRCCHYCIAGIVFLHFCLHGQTLSTRDYAIEITAQTQDSPPQVALFWRNNGDGLQYLVQRKLKGDVQWGPGAILPAGANSYLDTSVISGNVYEYSVTQTPPPPNAVSGYIMTGINAPLLDNRGRLILIVESSLATSLATELTQLQQDIVGDGWTVVRHDISSNATPPEVKALISAEFQSDPVNTRTVFLFGHVTVPYSGDYSPDVHPTHIGAWVADTYYGDLDGLWTDTTVFDTNAVRTANRNVPGDGKFDQSSIPSEIELEVGRVDLANMPSFLPLTEVDLLRAYLKKDHQYRMGMLAEPRRGLIYDGFGESGGQAFAASGWRNFAPFFSSANITEVGWGEFLPTLGAQGYLWSYAAGGGDGNYTDCYGVAQTWDFATTQIKTVFMMFFGSFFGDWDATDCIFRAPLCSGDCLTVAWAGRPHWFLHPMALGETIGYCTRLTQNNAGSYVPTNFVRGVHISLLGDPTLRLAAVLPPSSLAANTNTGSVFLSWSPSSDSGLKGYHVYRASNSNGPYNRLTSSPTLSLTYSDAVTTGAYSYMVRAVKMESTPSGSYLNPSQGVFASVILSLPTGPITLTNAQFSSEIFSFRCTGPTGQQFVIETSTDFRLWNPVVTNVLSDAGFLFSQTNASPNPSFYRTRLLQ